MPLDIKIDVSLKRAYFFRISLSIVHAGKAKRWDNNAQPQHIKTACATSRCMSFMSQDSEVKMRFIVIFRNLKRDIVLILSLSLD